MKNAIIVILSIVLIGVLVFVNEMRGDKIAQISSGEKVQPVQAMNPAVSSPAPMQQAAQGMNTSVVYDGEPAPANFEAAFKDKVNIGDLNVEAGNLLKNYGFKCQNLRNVKEGESADDFTHIMICNNSEDTRTEHHFNVSVTSDKKAIVKSVSVVNLKHQAEQMQKQNQAN